MLDTNLLFILLIFTIIEVQEFLGLTSQCFVAQTPPNFIHLGNIRQEVSSNLLSIIQFVKFHLIINPLHHIFNREVTISGLHSFSYHLNFDCQIQEVHQFNFFFRFFS